MPDKKTFNKKNQIHNLIRKAFNDGLDINDQDAVKVFIDGINNEYDLKPETLAYLVQSINRYALANEYRKANQEQVYPVLNLIDVVEFCKKYGYPNIYTTINDELSFKFTQKVGTGKTASRYSYDDYLTMKKAASLSNKETEFSGDTKMDRINKYAESKKAYLLDEMIETYWQTPNIERFIKAASLDTGLSYKEMLEKARERKVDTSAKYAGNEFAGFTKLISLMKEINSLNG